MAPDYQHYHNNQEPQKEKQINRAMKALVQKEPHLNINVVRVIVAIERAIARLKAAPCPVFVVTSGSMLPQRVQHPNHSQNGHDEQRDLGPAVRVFSPHFACGAVNQLPAYPDKDARISGIAGKNSN